MAEIVRPNKVSRFLGSSVEVAIPNTAYKIVFKAAQFLGDKCVETTQKGSRSRQVSEIGTQTVVNGAVRGNSVVETRLDVHGDILNVSQPRCSRASVARPEQEFNR